MGMNWNQFGAEDYNLFTALEWFIFPGYERAYRVYIEAAQVGTLTVIASTMAPTEPESVYIFVTNEATALTVPTESAQSFRGTEAISSNR